MLESEVEARIQLSFDRAIAGGIRVRRVRGASDAEIDALVRRQGSAGVPFAFRAVLRIMGRESGLWFNASRFGVDLLDEQIKQEALWCLDEADTVPLSDPNGLLVLGGTDYSYLVVDGSNVLETDPPTWVLTESGSIESGTDSITGWFEDCCSGVLRHRDDVLSRIARGRFVSPGYEDFLDSRLCPRPELVPGMDCAHRGRLSWPVR